MQGSSLFISRFQRAWSRFKASLWPDEPELAWSDHPWRYRPKGVLPRRSNPRRLPIHAPEFSRLWSDEFRMALLSASTRTQFNGIPLLRAWLGEGLALLRLPWWAISFRLAKILSDYADVPLPRDHATLADWYPPAPDLPAPWADLTEHTTRRLLDGFAAFPLLRSDDGTRIVLDHRWDDVPLRGPYALPNVRVTWSAPEPNAPFEMTSIRIAARRPSARRRPVPDGIHEDDPRYFDVRVVTPAAGAAWQHAQFVARSVSLTRGQTDVHLARTHLFVESVALCLTVHGDQPDRREPLARVRRLLRPFIRDVSGINRLGDALVLEGQGLLPRSTGLDDQGVGLRMADQLAEMDWRGFAPRSALHPVLGDGYVYGRAAQLFWTAIQRFVAAELATLPPARAAAEVAALRDALRAHNEHPTTPAGRSPPTLDGFAPLWPSEIGGPDRAPGHLSLPATVDDVRAFCCTVIFHATFAHSWVNDFGWRDGGSLRHASFGLKHLEAPSRWDEATFETWWQDALPPVRDCVPQIAVGWTLHQTRWGVVGNPDEPYQMETLDKQDDLPVVQSFVREMRAPTPDGGPSAADELVELGLPPLERWRIRVNT